MPIWEALIVLLLILLNGLLAMSEMAIVSSRRTRLEHLAARGNRGARAALRLIAHPARFLATVQVGITLIGIVAGAFGGAALAEPLGGWLDTLPGVAPNGSSIAIAAVIALITYLSLVIGELVPKRISLRAPERVAVNIARPMLLLSRLAAPAVWLLGSSTDLILRLLGIRGSREETVTEEEVRALISEGTQAGVFAPQEKKMIEGVLRLADRSVRATMRPRSSVVWLDVEDPPEVLRDTIRSARHSRFLVCRGELDELIGVVLTRDLLERALDGEPLDLAAAAVRPLIVHESLPVLRLLDMFRTSPVNLAVVVDEYGSIEGIVSPTDILEVVAGAVPEHGEAIDSEAVQRDDGSWLIDGMMPVDEFEDRLGLHGLKDTGEFDTVAGFALWQLGRLPKAGDSFAWRDWRFEVVDMDGRRIDKLLVVPPEDREFDHEEPAT
jgi:putative hemolysin